MVNKPKSKEARLLTGHSCLPGERMNVLSL